MMDVVIGLGEVGQPLSEILRLVTNVAGRDERQELNFGMLQDPLEIVHICFGYKTSFVDDVLSWVDSDFQNPKAIVIHSTVKPYTTKILQSKLPKIPVIYSPVRGLHKTMKEDLLEYTKFYAHYPHPLGWQASALFKERFKSATIDVQKASSPHLLEHAKILVDTSYYGWLIAYAQITNEICSEQNLDYDELWSFAEEIHAKLKNRPKMFPGIIGGHCVIPNAVLFDDPRISGITIQNGHYINWLEGAAKE